MLFFRKSGARRAEIRKNRPDTGASLAERVRSQGGVWSLGVAGLLCTSLLAPVAAYLGHKCLGRMRRQGVGLEHRGAALVGTTLGWLGNVYLVLVLLMDLRLLLEP